MLIKNSSLVVAVQLSLVADGHAAVEDDALVTLTYELGWRKMDMSR